MSEERPPSDAARDGAAQEEPGGRGDTSRSSAAENAGERRATDADAWSTACAEDLAAEQARRRGRYGPPPGSAAEELRKFVDTVADKLSSLQAPLLGALAGPAAEQVVRQMVQQAKVAVEPVVERNPEVFEHLAAAGGELLAAYRSAVESQERRWTSSGTGESPRDELGEPDTGSDDRRDPGEGTGGGERIDLD
ncbi:DUF5304 domain-containing protein [Streptomyces sp. NPDC058424]|uniref:DUF5304 domain-containing protein n=1 Tax=Streptomyces sp. NPDC058424 TaxID=3346491 RepID=UPI003651D98D